jgi:ribulose-phosphate 3-epimerase
MSKSIEVSASILAADFANLAYEITRSQVAGVDHFHIDVMDGHFVPNLTIGPMIIEAIRPFTKLPLEAHLMIEHPGITLKAMLRQGQILFKYMWNVMGIVERHAVNMANGLKR